MPVDFLTEEQQRRWRRGYEAAKRTADQTRLLGAFRREMKLLVVSGVWCGDCVEQVPLLQRLAEANPAKVELRLVDRDAAPTRSTAADSVAVALAVRALVRRNRRSPTRGYRRSPPPPAAAISSLRRPEILRRRSRVSQTSSTISTHSGSHRTSSMARCTSSWSACRSPISRRGPAGVIWPRRRPASRKARPRKSPACAPVHPCRRAIQGRGGRRPHRESSCSASLAPRRSDSIGTPPTAR